MTNRGMVFVSETVKWHHGSGLSEGSVFLPYKAVSHAFLYIGLILILSKFFFKYYTEYIPPGPFSLMLSLIIQGKLCV